MPSAPELRRCNAHLHHQFSPPISCLHCGEPTVGLRIADVVSGQDAQFQAAYRIWDSGRRTVSSTLKYSLVAALLISVILIFTTWWSLLLVPLTALFSYCRSLRLADGPDEVHRRLIAKIEMGRYLQKSH